MNSSNKFPCPVIAEGTAHKLLTKDNKYRQDYTVSFWYDNSMTNKLDSLFVIPELDTKHQAHILVQASFAIWKEILNGDG